MPYHGPMLTFNDGDRSELLVQRYDKSCVRLLIRVGSESRGITLTNDDIVRLSKMMPTL